MEGPRAAGRTCAGEIIGPHVRSATRCHAVNGRSSSWDESEIVNQGAARTTGGSSPSPTWPAQWKWKKSWGGSAGESGAPGRAGGAEEWREQDMSADAFMAPAAFPPAPRGCANPSPVADEARQKLFGIRSAAKDDEADLRGAEGHGERRADPDVPSREGEAWRLRKAWKGRARGPMLEEGAHLRGRARSTRARKGAESKGSVRAPRWGRPSARLQAGAAGGRVLELVGGGSGERAPRRGASGSARTAALGAPRESVREPRLFPKFWRKMI